MGIETEINEKLNIISKKMDEITVLIDDIRTLLTQLKYEEKEKKVKVALSPTLEITYNALKENSPTSASEMARITGKARPNESQRLNELVEMGLAEKIRQGKRVLFQIKRN